MMKQTKQAGKIRTMLAAAAAVMIGMTAALPVYALEDGAYLVARTTSYANPETGETVDGGTNIALGDSMCKSIVEDTVLVEFSQGKTYVSIGVGLISNIGEVKIQVQAADGTYRDAEITETGSHERDGDTCKHFRFEVDSTENYISPILYVTPMGRDVQFFIRLNMDTAQPGNGDFISEMVKLESTAESVSSKTEIDSTPAADSSKASQSSEPIETSAAAAAGTANEAVSKKDTEAEKQTGKSVILLVSIAVIVLAGSVILLICRKRKNKKW